MNKLVLATAVALTFGATSVQAAETIITPSNTTWRQTTGGAGAAVITDTEGRSGGGSLELRGDASRYTLGGSGFLAATITSLANARALTFDWRIAGDTVSALNPDYTPALRLLIKNGLSSGELIWEGAYNGVYGPQTEPDIWYSITDQSKFYFGRGNENAGRTIAEWAAFMPTWNVTGISVGQGSGAGTGYHAFADNVTFTTTSGSTTYNFETTLTAAVPEPATWAMMLVGFGGVGFAMRRRKSKVTTNVAFA